VAILKPFIPTESNGNGSQTAQEENGADNKKDTEK